jgi:hypothetical protein
MGSEVPQWIRLAVGTWGRQKRRAWAGHSEWYLDSKGLRKVHVDGYAQSFMGKMMAERGGFLQGAIHQHWDEVYWGEGLDVQRVLPGMPEAEYTALHLMRVFDPEFGLTVPKKAALAGMKLTTFKEAALRAEWWIWARLEPGAQSAAQVIGLVEETIKRALQSKPPKVINAQPGRFSPELNISALNRPMICLKPKVA